MIGNHKAMLDALKSRKGSGLDLTIVIGEDPSAKDEKETKELGLAPDATPIKEGKEIAATLPDDLEQKMDHDVLDNAPVLPEALPEEEDTKSLVHRVLSKLGHGTVAGKHALKMKQ